MSEGAGKIETPIIDGLGVAGTWVNEHSELLIQYGVNLISAILILFFRQYCC